ncbi:MAG: BrnT family toxin [Fimbriimonadaceae bacterium]
MTFEWDDKKAATNVRKHGVSFEEAATAFRDPLYLVFADPDHSIKEGRFLLFGVSEERRLLVVSYTQREKSIRLVSAREATRRERKSYEEDY